MQIVARRDNKVQEKRVTEPRLWGIAQRLGEIVPVEDIRELAGQDQLLLELQAGSILRCSVARQEPHEMIVACVQNSMEITGLAPDEIDAVVHVTGADIRSVEDDICVIRALAAAGLSEAVPMSVALNGCASGNVALMTADGLLSRGARNVLVLHAEFVGDGRRIQPPAVAMTGDGVASAILSRATLIGPSFTLIDSFARTSAELCDIELTDDNLGEYIAATLSGLRKTAATLYERHGLKPEDFKYLLPPRFSKTLVNMVALATGFSDQQIYQDETSDVGHIMTADGLIALQTAKLQSEIASGDLVLLFGVGTFSWSVACLRVD